MIILRAAKSTDLEALIQLYSDFFEEDGIETSVADISNNLNVFLMENKARLMVAQHNDTLMALASATLSHGIEFGLTAELEDLYVLPAFRGQGIARKLIAAISDWAKDNFAMRLSLVITEEAESQQHLTAFYEKFGFKRLPRATMIRSLSSD